MFMPSGVAAAAAGVSVFDMVAGTLTINSGYRRASFGTLDPEEGLFLPYGLTTIQDLVIASNLFLFTAIGASIPNADSTFSTITITGTFNDGATPLVATRSAMNYTPDEGNGNSRWSVNVGSKNFVNGNAYVVTFA